MRLDRAVAYIPDMSNLYGAEEIFTARRGPRLGLLPRLSTLLRADARDILADIWHVGPMSHAKRVDKVEKQADKRAIEVARYVLPVAAATTMVHTVSGIVLHRLWRMSAASDTPSEARLVIGEMVRARARVDPQFFDRFDDGPMEELPEWAAAAAGRDRRRSPGARIRRATRRAHFAAGGLFAGGGARDGRGLSRRRRRSPSRLAPTPKRSTACSIRRATPIAWKRSTSACMRR